jgi:hypothetical protein
MRKRIRSAIVLMAALALLAVLGAALAFAENIDPGDDDSQYAWGEAVGWLNAEPANCSGCGVQVTDTGLTGYMWGESIGWINLSCQNNPSTCATTANYGVTNDGAGNLAGYAWGESVGWISFSCQNNPPTCATTANYGVAINPTTGVFSGYAWGESIGWINFGGTNPNPVVTSWSPAVPVGGIAELPDIEGPSDRDYTPYAAGAALVVVIAAGLWYARRRWSR